jgi:hypothetical protein
MSWRDSADPRNLLGVSRGPGFAFSEPMTSIRIAMFLFSLTCAAGCGCGVGAVPSSTGDTANVAADGTVVFNSIAVGATETFSIPVKESADTDETIVMANVSGAFKVLSTFPIYVPRGGSVNVEVSFTPVAAGEASSDLVLETAKMGSSHVPLTGTGLAR